MAATHTTRLNLNMPNEGDFVSVVTDINENMQSIDNAFGMIGSQYDPTATYLKDDYCVHDAKFYRALQDIDTPEAWDATHWVESNIIDEITGTAHSASTLRDIPIMIATTDWTLTGGKYVAEFDTAYITETSKDFVIFDESYKMFAQADVVADKKTGGGGMVFKTAVQPIGYISGTIYTVDANDGKVPVLLEDTVTPITNGGTGQSTLAGAKQAFGITDLEGDVTTIQNDVTTLSGNLASINTKLGTNVVYRGSEVATAKNGATVDTSVSYTRALKGCGIVLLELRIACPTFSSETVIATLASGIRPFADVTYIKTFDMWGTDINGNVTIRSGGNIEAQPICSGKNIQIVVAYPVVP